MAYGSVRQRGFLTLSLLPYIAIAALSVAALVSWNLYRTKAHELESFKVAVKVAGDAQEAKTKATIEQQKRSADEAEKRSKRTLADIRAKYDKLRLANPGGGKLPAVPDTAPVANAEARDSRLLEVLRIAEEQAGQLSELQDWIKAQEGK